MVVNIFLIWTFLKKNILNLVSVLTILALFGCVTNLNTKISKIEKTEILNNQQQTTTEQNISKEKNAKKE